MSISHWLSLIFIICSSFVDSQTLNQSKSLMADMLSGYDRRHRPIENQSLPIQVNVTFDIVALQTFDEVEQKFTVGGIMYIVWEDEKIRWNPADYGGITTQLYHVSDVWYPVLILGNPHGDVNDIGAKWMTVRHYFNGKAVFTPGSVFKATCSVDVTYYPFDTQVCYLIFTPWGYNLEEMNLVPTQSDILQTYFTENGEWTIVSTSAKAYDNFLWFGFEFKRKPTFLIVNVLLPIVFMAFVNVLTFLLPAESGERISYSITCLLAIAVFLTLVSGNLPKTSKPMSVLCYYLMIILVSSTLICLSAILNLKLFFMEGKKPVPRWCKKFVRLIFCKGEKCHGNDSGNALHSAVKSDNSRAISSEQQIEREITDDRNDISWHEACCAADQLCIVSFTFVILLATGVFLGVLVSNSGKH